MINKSQVNKSEQQRIKSLIEIEQDQDNKAFLQDDLIELEENPAKYWLRFTTEGYKPKDIAETQRLNTINAMKIYYSNQKNSQP